MKRLFNGAPMKTVATGTDKKGCFLEKCRKSSQQELVFGFEEWQSVPLGILVILSCRHSKNSKCRERLSRNSPYLPTDRSPKGTEWSKTRSLDISLPRKDCLLSQEKRVDVNATPRHTLSQTVYPHLLKAHSSFLEIFFSLLRGLHRPPSFPIKMVFEPEF